MSVRIAPSLLAADFANMAREVSDVERRRYFERI